MAPRFRSLVLVAGGVVAGAMVTAGIGAYLIAGTGWGRDIVRGQVERQIAARLTGKARVTLGPVSGNFVTGVRLDWIEVRDDEDSLVFRSGAIAATYDVRDLLAQRFVFTDLALDTPVLVLRQHADRSWNYQRIARPGTGKPGPRPLIRATNVKVAGGRVVVTLPWTPEPWLGARARDSTAAARLRSGEVTRTSEGLKRSWRWRELSLAGTALAASDPAHDGGSLTLSRLAVTEAFPPLAIVDAQGTARWFSDSAQLDIRRLRLPHSVASARGVVRWKRDSPVNVDLRVRADTVGLADLAWVYPTMPTTGGGRADLHVSTNAHEPRVMEYALGNMDLRTGGSRVRGGVTFGVGGPLLRITSVAVTADPLTTADVERFLGGPLPLPLKGSIRGVVRGAGGPLDTFVLDTVQATYTDERVRDAPVPVRVRGTLDLSRPGATAYRDLELALPRLDARVMRQFAPSMPDLHGAAAFSATMDGGAAEVHLRGIRASFADEDRHVTGATGEADLVRGSTGVEAYDARMQLDSLDFDVVTHTWPQVPLRGALGGPVTVVGNRTSARVLATLDGDAGGVDANLTVTVPPGLSITGTFGTRALLMELVPGAGTTSALTSEITANLRGDSLAVFEGTVRAAVAGTKFGDLVVTGGKTALAFAEGRVRVDTLLLESGTARLDARGALALRRGAGDDTVRVTFTADSLAALRTRLRPFVGEARIAADSGAGARMLWNDTLQGAFAGSLTVTGRVDSLQLAGEARAVAAQVGAARADTIAGSWNLSLVARDAVGTGEVRLARARWGTQRIDGARARLTMRPGTLVGVALDGTAARGYNQLAARAQLDLRGDTAIVALDSLAVDFGADKVRLSAPTRLVVAPGSITLDSTRATAGRGGRLTLAGRLADTGPIRGRLLLEEFPFTIQDSASQSPPRVAALVNARIDLEGTRDAPRFDALLDADRVLFFGKQAGAARVTGEYARRRLSTTVRLDEGSDGMLLFAGDVPVDLSLRAVPRRLLDEPLVGTLRTDSLRLGFLHRVLPALTEAGGTLRTDLIVGGRLERPSFEGRIQLDSGVIALAEQGLQLRAIVADVNLRRDSVLVTRFEATGDRRPGESLVASGYAWLPDTGTGALDLRVKASRFGAVRQRSVASLDVNGEVRVTGTRDDARIAGDVEVFDAIAYLGTKFVADAEATSRLTGVVLQDTLSLDAEEAPARAPTLLERMKSRVSIDHLQLRLGDNVRLRSADANVLLGGAIVASGKVDNIALAGDLTARRGLYRLNLGLVTRTFTVDSGRVTFQGPLANSPLLNITTTYLVRLENRDQVHIRAQILGTVAEPRIVLSSDDQATTGASDTELLSYLIFGVPSFALSGQNASALRTVQNALAPTLGGVAERALSAVLPGVDMVRVTMASQSDASASSDPSGGLLTSSSITAGQQLGDRVFVSVNTGLCKRTGSSDLGSLAPWIGLSIEYRLGPSSWIEASMDPGTASCTRSTDAAAVRQFGLDLYREFRFR